MQESESPLQPVAAIAQPDAQPNRSPTAIPFRIYNERRVQQAQFQPGIGWVRYGENGPYAVNDPAFSSADEGGGPSSSQESAGSSGGGAAAEGPPAADMPPDAMAFAAPSVDPYMTVTGDLAPGRGAVSVRSSSSSAQRRWGVRSRNV